MKGLGILLTQPLEHRGGARGAVELQLQQPRQHHLAHLSAAQHLDSTANGLLEASLIRLLGAVPSLAAGQTADPGRRRDWQQARNMPRHKQTGRLLFVEGNNPDHHRLAQARRLGLGKGRLYRPFDPVAILTCRCLDGLETAAGFNPAVRGIEPISGCMDIAPRGAPTGDTRQCIHSNLHI
ncbi:hypothetical protein FQZ97_833840 [compost metagenome]